MDKSIKVFIQLSKVFGAFILLCATLINESGLSYSSTWLLIGIVLGIFLDDLRREIQ